LKDNIFEFAELFKNIGLGLFVNGSFCIGSIIAMYVFIKIERIYE